ncbi:MAG: cyclic nucleotide-binding domain-containing protein [Chlamydiota bacterium]
MNDLFNDLPMLDGIDVDQFLKHFEIQNPVTFKSDEFIFRQNDVSDKFYILLEGKVKVFLEKDLGEDIFLGYVSIGYPIGEMSLLTETSRTASVISESESKLISLNIQDFKEKIKANDPFSLKLCFNMAKILSRRLSNSLKIINRVDGQIRQGEIATFREKLTSEGLF